MAFDGAHADRLGVCHTGGQVSESSATGFARTATSTPGGKVSDVSASGFSRLGDSFIGGKKAGIVQ